MVLSVEFGILLFFCLLFIITFSNQWIGEMVKKYKLHYHGSFTSGVVIQSNPHIKRTKIRGSSQYIETTPYYMTEVKFLNYIKTFKVYKSYSRGDELMVMYMFSNPKYSIVGNPEDSIFDILNLSSFWGNIYNLFMFTVIVIPILLLSFSLCPDRILRNILAKKRSRSEINS
jgi:hypothetical protein